MESGREKEVASGSESERQKKERALEENIKKHE